MFIAAMMLLPLRLTQGFFMLHSLIRSLKCRQVGQIQMSISVNGTAGSPVASGPDKAFIESIVKNSTGSYTITVKESAKMPLFITGAVCLGGAHKTPSIIAVSVNSFTINFEDRLGAAADCDFNVAWQYFDQLSYFF